MDQYIKKAQQDTIKAKNDYDTTISSIKDNLTKAIKG